MLLHCPSKKCNTTREHKIKNTSNEAVCMECGETNADVTSMMKTAMKANGDIFKVASSTQAFTYLCANCTVSRQAKVKEGVVVCSHCGVQMKNLSGPTIEAIKSMGSKVDDDAEDGSTLNKGMIKRRKS